MPPDNDLRPEIDRATRRGFLVLAIWLIALVVLGYLLWQVIRGIQSGGMPWAF